MLQQPELATDPRFASNSRRIASARRRCARSSSRPSRALTAEQVIARLDAAQIANARMNDMHEVWEHPQLQARERWTQVATPAGPIPALLPPGKTAAYEPRMDAVPALGEHTEAILAELGWSEPIIARLRREGVV